jgi:hypothetical protein
MDAGYRAAAESRREHPQMRPELARGRARSSIRPNAVPSRDNATAVMPDRVFSPRYPTPSSQVCHFPLLYLSTYKGKQGSLALHRAGVWRPRKEADHGMGARHMGCSGNDPSAVDGATGHHSCTLLRIAPSGCTLASRRTRRKPTTSQKKQDLNQGRNPLGREARLRVLLPGLGAQGSL